MIAQLTSYDVFLSYSATDSSVAEVVEKKLSESGLRVFSSRNIRAGETWADTIREALAECIAVVVIVTRASLKSSWFALELGAAWAWKKPVFPLVQDVEGDELPVFLRSYHAVPIARTHEVAEGVRRAMHPLSEMKEASLIRLYQKLGVAADQLTGNPAALTKLTRTFNRATHSNLSPELTLRELLRLRKRRALPTFRSATRKTSVK